MIHRPARCLLPVIAAAVAFAALLSSQPAFAQEHRKLTVVLDWFVNPDHAPVIVALQQGFFEEAGLEVELVEPADPNLPPKMAAAGEADIAITYQPQLHMLVDQDVPVKRIGTLVATPLNALVALEGSGIESLVDLKGRTIGYSVGGFEDALLGGMLAEAGLGLADVKLVNVNFSLSPALLSGQVDAVIGAFRNFELNQLALEGTRGIAFYPEEHGVPNYDELIYVAGEQADPTAIAAFLGAVERATVFILNHREEALEAFLSYDEELDNELNRRAWRDTLPRLSLSPGALDPERYVTFSAFMAKAGLIAAPQPIEALSILPQAE
jgi:putative hydroxymethylpyrimidine transport system substrate-binding protein